MLGGGRSGCNGRFPFTASQWQELEHQALIYKYMASGAPVPYDLLLPIRRSFLLDTPLAMATPPSLPFPPPQPTLGWGCFQLGYGRKPEDPEPGRCRRTDGKKWRCSKEAYPDSKYCEKHMHRGKNRSRKPVEMSLATPSVAAAAASSSSSTSPIPAAVSNVPRHPLYAAAGNHDGGGHYQHLYPYGVPSRAPFHGSPAASLHLPHFSYGADCKDYRYGHGMKELDEHSFFSDLPERESPWQQQKAAAGLNYGAGCGAVTAFVNPVSLTKENAGGEADGNGAGKQHCFLLGADLRLDKPTEGADDGDNARRPLRHFFDEWPHEKSTKDSWMGGLEGETQLSISIPMASGADIPISASGFNHGH